MTPALPLQDAHAEQLDCFQVNLAALAARHHGPHVALGFGATLGFAAAPRLHGLPSVEPHLDAHLASADAHLGLHVDARWHVAPGAYATLLPDGRDAVYVIADAFHLPWVPYCGQQHMEHSFIIERGDDGLRVTDHYWNDTQWGPARPGSWRLSQAELAAAVCDGAHVIAFTPHALARPMPEPRYAAPASADVEAYLAAYRGHADRATALAQLTLETWLLARSRRLHVTLRTWCGEDPARWSDMLREWRAVVEQTYLALRRVQRGHPEPGAVLDRLAALLASEPASFAAPTFFERVAAEVAAVLRVDAAALRAGEPFTIAPTFSSFRIVEIVERLEERLGVSFDPDDLVPENLHRLDDLCRIARLNVKEPT
ncbi:hypothetical protein [Burkholderia gladioli]|uniref:hypothetical protein n=1 Tax=Burkholderia gladioli TaxID=28095 RepID=UPI00164014BA|nr:hypothetical protein [Burkholderia gladioli]